MYAREATVFNKTGLHARPATDFVTKAKAYQSKVLLRNLDTDSLASSAKSIVLVLAQGIGPGNRVEVAAEGADEREAVDSLIALIETGFGE